MELLCYEAGVLEPGQATVRELAQTAETEHAKAVEAAHSSLMHAVRAGEALVQLREQVPRGEWETWLADNVRGIPPRMVRPYIRLATYKEHIPGRVSTASEALVYLRGAPAFDGTGPVVHSAEVRAEAVRLAGEGLSQRNIAEMLGVGKSCVGRWLQTPSASGNTKRAGQRRAALLRRRAAEEALRREERQRAIRRAVKRAGGAIAEAYAMAERMQDVLGQAHDEAQSSEARCALALAGQDYRSMRDHIVRALGVE